MLQIEALEILKTGANVFLTGVPGAGKTYVINQYTNWLLDKGIYPAITASTGIASTHIGGNTIHSFSGIGIEKDLDEYKIEKIMEREKLVKKIQNTNVLIIDEISMLDAATLDNVNKVLKAIKDPTKAFGGVQIIFVGDFFQLPPVTRQGEAMKYFAFHSQAWKEARPLTCYLEEQFRQTDETFTKLLLAIRENNIDEMHVEILEELKMKTHKKLGLKTPTPTLPQGEGEEPTIQYPDINNEIHIHSYNKNLTSTARQNRQNPTEAEEKFWEMVRDNKIGFEFQRQKPIKNFILDFYIKEKSLGIEIDGGYHDNESDKARDEERTQVLNDLGVQVLRFTNEEVNAITKTDLFLKINSVEGVPIPNGEGAGVGVINSEAQTNDILELHSHNKNVDEINNLKLAKIKSKEFVFKMETYGRASLVEGLVRNCLSPEILKLKKGAKVIFTKNDIEGKYVNGTMGVVEELDDIGIVVLTNKKQLIELKKEEWAIEEDGKVKARILQYPLRLAWAITVHKSQGMSLDEAIIDLGQTFEYGQGYVALSRVRSLDGLFLKDYNAKSLRVNEAISEFDEKIRKDSRFIQEKFQTADKKKLNTTQKSFIEKIGGRWEGGVIRKEMIDKKSTIEITLDLINEGKAIVEVAELRDMSEKTIQQHLIELFVLNKIDKKTLGKIVKDNFGFDIFDIPNVVKKSFKKNMRETDEHGRIKLAPVFKDLNEKYTYEQLKFWRIFI